MMFSKTIRKRYFFNLFSRGLHDLTILYFLYKKPAKLRSMWSWMNLWKLFACHVFTNYNQYDNYKTAALFVILLTHYILDRWCRWNVKGICGSTKFHVLSNYSPFYTVVDCPWGLILACSWFAFQWKVKINVGINQYQTRTRIDNWVIQDLMLTSPTRYDHLYFDCTTKILTQGKNQYWLHVLLLWSSGSTVANYLSSITWKTLQAQISEPRMNYNIIMVFNLAVKVHLIVGPSKYHNN